MDFEEALYNLHRNNKLNERGYSDYVDILRGHITDLKIKIMDLESELQYKKKG